MSGILGVKIVNSLLIRLKSKSGTEFQYRFFGGTYWIRTNDFHVVDVTL